MSIWRFMIGWWNKKNENNNFAPTNDRRMRKNPIWTIIDNEFHHRITINSFFTTGVYLKVGYHHKDHEKNLAYIEI